MNVWRALRSSLGVCDELAPEERCVLERDYAATVTKHPVGCKCHWCDMAKLGADRRD